MTKSEQIEVAVELDDITHARFEALLGSLSKERDVTESGVLREVLVAALEEVEKDPERFAEQLRAQR
jgi:hypothetical protein